MCQILSMLQVTSMDWTMTISQGWTSMSEPWSVCLTCGYACQISLHLACPRHGQVHVKPVTFRQDQWTVRPQHLANSDDLGVGLQGTKHLAYLEDELV